jgi:DNA-binding MarR family transcriptional regulator/GNAT superfamily N-acetyltransferase
MSTTVTAAKKVRRFNRFYTQRMGLLNSGLLESPFSLSEVRVLYEIAHRSRPTAKVIAGELQLDEGYLSRLLRGLRQRGLITTRAAPHDRRERWIALTSRGRNAFSVLDDRATREIGAMLEGLSAAAQQRLLSSISAIETVLNNTATSASAPRPVIALREPQPGDLGWVVQRHGELYATEYGWTVEFERLVAKIVGDFAAADPGSGNRCWIALVDGERAGSILLVPASPEVARLRLLLVEPWARGLGIGTRLVQECIQAARTGGYRTVTLWTNDVLVDARRLYERAGFHLVKSEPHQSFGQLLVGQNWELPLS